MIVPRYPGSDPDGVAETEADYYAIARSAARLSKRAIWLRCWRMFTMLRLKQAKVRSRRGRRSLR
jgi:hypothetical protein